MLSDHQRVLKKSSFLKEVEFQLGPAVWEEGRDEDLHLYSAQKPMLTSRLCTSASPPALLHSPASLLMAPLPLWAGLLGSLSPSPLDGCSWWAGPQSNPVCAQCPAKSWPSGSALGFLTGEMNKGRVLEKPFR